MKAPIWGTGRAALCGAAILATAMFQLAGAASAADVFNPFSAAARPAPNTQPAQPVDGLAAPDYYAPSPMQPSLPTTIEAAGPAMPSTVAAPATAPAASAPSNFNNSSSSWSKPFHPIQAAFHQLNGPGGEAQPIPPSMPPAPPGLSSVRTDGVQPPLPGSMEPAPYPAAAPSGQMYMGPVTPPNGCG